MNKGFCEECNNLVDYEIKEIDEKMHIEDREKENLKNQLSDNNKNLENKKVVRENLKQKLDDNNLKLKNMDKQFMEVKSFEMNGKRNPHVFSFNVIPLINATIRSGTFEEKIEMQQAFISDDYEFCKEVANKQ